MYPIWLHDEAVTLVLANKHFGASVCAVARAFDLVVKRLEADCNHEARMDEPRLCIVLGNVSHSPLGQRAPMRQDMMRSSLYGRL